MKPSREIEDSGADDVDGLRLRRNIGLASAVGFIVSDMIGSGIFISPGGVVNRTGSVGLALTIWALCGFLSVLGALSYAELGTLIPKSGSNFSYLLDGLKSYHPFWGPLPAFLFSWVSVLITHPASVAIGCLSCASYTVYPITSAFNTCLTENDLEITIKLVAVLYLGLTVALNCSSVNWSLRVVNAVTFAKLIVIVILIGSGIYQLWNGRTQSFQRPFHGSITDFSAIAMAFYSGLWSYYGWSALNYVTEELKNPYEDLPRAIIISITLVTAVYLGVNVAYLSVLSPQEITTSEAVAVDVGNYLLGSFSVIVPAAVALAIFGGVLSTAFVTSRLCYVTAREGHMVDLLSYVHVESRTPSPALLFTGAISLVMILAQDITSLIDFFGIIVWIFFTLSMALLLLLRKTRPNDFRPYRAPLIAPITVMLVGFYLVIAPVLHDPAIEYLYVLGILLLGFLFYIPFVYLKLNLPGIVKVYELLQIALNVGPTAKSSS